MGFLAPAIPWIVKGGAALGGYLMSRHAQKSAEKRSPEEQLALQQGQQAGTNLTQQGTQLSGMGTGAITPTLNYYQTLLRGSRGAMANATAGPRGAITDTYRGAERNLEHSGVVGAQRDQITGDLARDKAAKIAGLTSGVQPAAASALGDLGTNLTSQAGTNFANAGQIWNALLGKGFENRKYAREEGANAGKTFGSFLFDILSGVGGGKGGVLPSKSIGSSTPIPLPGNAGGRQFEY